MKSTNVPMSAVGMLGLHRIWLSVCVLIVSWWTTSDNVRIISSKSAFSNSDVSQEVQKSTEACLSSRRKRSTIQSPVEITEILRCSFCTSLASRGQTSFIWSLNLLRNYPIESTPGTVCIHVMLSYTQTVHAQVPWQCSKKIPTNEVLQVHGCATPDEKPKSKVG